MLSDLQKRCLAVQLYIHSSASAYIHTCVYRAGFTFSLALAPGDLPPVSVPRSLHALGTCLPCAGAACVQRIEPISCACEVRS